MECVYLGQSCVRLKGREVQVLVDPPSPKALPGFPKQSPEIIVRTQGLTDAKLLLPSPNRPQEISGPGEYEIRGVRIRGIQVEEDVALMAIDVDDIRVVCLGALERLLTDAEIDSIGNVDVLVLPVGGHDSLTPEQASLVVTALEPSIVIPVRFGSLKKSPYASISAFAEEMGVKEVWSSAAKLTLNGKPASDDTKIVFLEPKIEI